MSRTNLKFKFSNAPNSKIILHFPIHIFLAIDHLLCWLCIIHFALATLLFYRNPVGFWGGLFPAEDFFIFLFLRFQSRLFQDELIISGIRFEFHLQLLRFLDVGSFFQANLPVSHDDNG